MVYLSVGHILLLMLVPGLDLGADLSSGIDLFLFFGLNLGLVLGLHPGFGGEIEKNKKSKCYS